MARNLGRGLCTGCKPSEATVVTDANTGLLYLQEIIISATYIDVRLKTLA